MSDKLYKIEESLDILKKIGMPTEQQNKRSALCLLCLANITSDKKWADAKINLIGITPIMEWCKKYYNVEYAPNSRETFRRFTIHQFIEAGICIKNPNDPKRSINSPNTVYQIDSEFLKLIKFYGNSQFSDYLTIYLSQRPKLIKKYAREREINQVPVVYDKQILKLSSGEHSILIKKIIEEFGRCFTPNGKLVYVGDTGNKYIYYDQQILSSLNITLDNHGKFPDIIIYYEEKQWLVLIESVTSHGPVDSKRYLELSALFQNCIIGIVYVSAFLSRKDFMKYSNSIAWESDVWIADTPTHMIHFNGSRFLGPYSTLHLKNP